MWFKNLALYRFSEPFTTSPEELELKLKEKPFRPCGSHDQISMGWVSPIDPKSDLLTHVSNGFIMICLKQQEKVLPSTVVNEMLLEKVTEIETLESRKLAKKERSRIKDDLIFELLPKAFSFSKKTFAYIDPKGGWVVVDAASAKKAEDLLSLLRKTIGSLPVVPVNTLKKPASLMTQWLQQPESVPNDLIVEDECELRSIDAEASIIRCKRHNLGLPEITNHIDNGKQVIKLALNWSDRLSFVIDESISIKRLKFLDLIQDQVREIDVDDAASQFDADFSIMSLELSHFLPRLIDIFGGENKT